MKRICLSKVALSKILVRISLVVLIAFRTSNLSAQVFNGNVVLMTQAEADAFNYTSITGFLGIQGGGDITNLNGLSELVSLGDGFIIFNTDFLSNVDGLSNLQSIGGNIIIRDNRVLQNLNGLSTLASAGGYFEIHDNPLLTTINLANLSSITNYLNIHENNALTTISIKTQPGSLTIGGYLTVFSNPVLTNINLPGLTSVGEQFSIPNSLLLNTIDAPNLLSAGGLSISGSPVLANINMTGLITVGTDLSLSGTALIDLSGFSNLTSAEQITLSGNTALVNLNGLSNLVSVSTVIIGDNAVLNNISGLSGLTTIDGILHITFNPALTNLGGLSNLTSIGAAASATTPSLFIFVNQSLTNLNGLSNLTSVSGNLRISSNAVLSEFCGLYTLLNGNGLVGTYTVSGNGINPTIQQIIGGGECDALNNCPVASNSGTTVVMNGSINFLLQATDADGEPLQYSISQPPAHGTVVLQVQTGMGTYTPAPGYCGPDEFKFKVKDPDECFSNEATASVTMICNDCPVANSLSLSLGKNGSINFQLLATDPGGDVLQYSIITPPSHGIVVLNSQTGTGTYTPAVGYSGPDQFRYKVSDGSCEREATVTITVVICPEGKGYWKNNPGNWPAGSTPMLLGTQSYTKAELLVILNTPIGTGQKADASLILAHQLIAAKLNVLNGAITPSPVPDSITVADLIIGNNRMPMKIRPNTPLGQRMVNNADLLEVYNSGLLTEACRTQTDALTSSKSQNFFSESSNVSDNVTEIKVYPNPSTGNFTINIKGNTTKERITMQVIDMYGRIIETGNANSLIRFGDRYNPGTYFVRIIQGMKHKEIKLIKL